eukprot:6106377-Prymnesium_polylepis.1
MQSEPPEMQSCAIRAIRGAIMRNQRRNQAQQSEGTHLPAEVARAAAGGSACAVWAAAPTAGQRAISALPAGVAGAAVGDAGAVRRAPVGALSGLACCA